jgi:hypothetical protein
VLPGDEAIAWGLTIIVCFWEKASLVGDVKLIPVGPGSFRHIPVCLCQLILICLLLMVPFAAGSAGDKAGDSPGFVIELPAKESVVLEIVKDVAGDSLVRGTYVYEKEQTLSGAMPANSSDYFGPWHGPGHVFYKVLTGAIAPRHFKNSSDTGAITVRYVVEPVNELRTRLRIDAVFVESGRRRADASDGSVEAAEFKAIQDKLQQVELAEQEAAAASVKRQEEEAAKATLLRQRQEEAGRVEAAQSSIRDLEERIHGLRQDVEVRVKEENTELKSAPFNKAAKLQSLAAGTEVVVAIVTPYWFGVETPDGHRGWLRRDQVEPIP